MEEIICSEPWQCEDEKCPVQWHVCNYWQYEDGSVGVDRYADGDHEPADWRDIPVDTTPAWGRYASWVVAHGRDPLGEYHVPTTIPSRQAWKFKFAPSIAGVVLLSAKRSGRSVPREHLPLHVREFLGLRADNKHLGVESWSELEDHNPGLKPDTWMEFVLPYKRSRSEAAVRRDLLKLVRKDLRRMLNNA